MTEPRAIVLFAHGARDPEWADPFKKIRARVQTRLPATPVELAFLEFMQPDLASAVGSLAARGARHVSVVPLFMAQGGHLKHDLPGIIERLRAAHPGLSVALRSPIGDVEPILAAIADWIVSETTG